MLIETPDNELIIHPLVSDPIEEGSGSFEKETLDSRELKMFAETSRVISKVWYRFWSCWIYHKARNLTSQPLSLPEHLPNLPVKPPGLLYITFPTGFYYLHWSSVKEFDRVGMYYFPKDQLFHTILQFNLNRTRMTRIWRIFTDLFIIRAIRVPLQYYS